MIKAFLNKFSYTFWMIFIFGIAVIAMWFTVEAVGKLMDYWHLNQRVPAIIKEWKIENERDDRYAVRAMYTYEVGEKSFTGVTVFKDQLFRNPLAGETYLKELSNQSWKVWFNSAQPQYSNLVREMPWKEIIRVCVAVAVFVYFLWIGKSFKLRLFK